ncbi:hypothetical protein D6C92_10517 [Aureobasidium pullulans]|nr:hypothetical protein D6C92_10517 [Aureobasidium pullulans]
MPHCLGYRNTSMFFHVRIRSPSLRLLPLRITNRFSDHREDVEDHRLLAAILLPTRPRWYLYQSLISNLLWVMPWAIVVSKAHITPEDAWTYHSIVFGGSLVFSFFDVLVVHLVWAWALLRGKMRLPAIY